MRRAAAAAVILCLAVLVAATLLPTGGTASNATFWCIACGELGPVDVVVNIVMFVPFGFALLLATGRRWTSVAVCVVTTLAIELLQVSVVTGRDASLSDLVANSLGGWIGVELANQRAALLLPRAVSARRLAVAWALAFAAVCGLASAGLRPATIPRSLWVQWTPQRPGYGPFTGRLLAFDVDGIDLPLGFPAPALGVDRVLRGDTWRATATIAADSLERRRSVIVRIAEEVTVLVSIEQSGWDLACLQKTRSADFRFRSPRVALEDAFSLADAETPSVMKLVCAREHAALVASTGGKREIMRFGPALGWLLVSPFDIAMTRSRWWMNALWLIGLTIPMGYWGGLAWESAAAGRRGRRAVVAAVGISLLCGLAVAPSVADVAVATAWEWAAAFAGVALGYGVSRVARRWRPDVS